MREVLTHEELFGLREGAAHRAQLVDDLGAGLAVGGHAPDGTEVAVGARQAIDERAVAEARGGGGLDGDALLQDLLQSLGN